MLFRSWSLGDSVFSGNAWDIQVTNSQIVSACGAWFENSTNGIYQATTAHTLSMAGCYLHTSNATRLMDMQSAAGHFVLKGCFAPVASASTLVKNINPSYEYDISTSNVSIDTGYRQWSQGVTRADQAAFAAGLTSDTTNDKTGDGTTYSLNAVGFTEESDAASAFDASTGIFTAPVSSYYQ